MDGMKRQMTNVEKTKLISFQGFRVMKVLEDGRFGKI
jgi:hypothetical protein